MYSKTYLERPLKRRPKIGFQDQLLLMQVKSIAECSKGSILQYFLPSLKLPFIFKTFVLSFFEWPLKTGFTVLLKLWNDFCFGGFILYSLTLYNKPQNLVYFSKLLR